MGCLFACIVAIHRASTLPFGQFGSAVAARARLVGIGSVAAFARAPFTLFTFARVPQRNEQASAPITGFCHIAAVLCEEFVGLL
jgi:hypothetical protein